MVASAAEKLLMGSRPRPGPDRLPILGVAVTCLCFALLAIRVFSVRGSGDYMVGGPVGGDNAGPAIRALLHGSIGGYLHHQPVIGLTSLLLRLPFAALAPIFGGGSLVTYQLGALACMLPVVLLTGWLVAAPGLTTGKRLLRSLAMLLVVLSPIMNDKLVDGHPEGAVAAVLAVGAVIAATRGRSRWSAVMLGLAIGTKEWALIAALPVMIALPERRREVGVIAGALTFLLCGLPWLIDPNAFLRALHGEGTTQFLNQFSLLWPLGSPVHLAGAQSIPSHRIPFGMHRLSATVLTTRWCRCRRDSGGSGPAGEGRHAIPLPCWPCSGFCDACATLRTSSTTWALF